MAPRPHHPAWVNLQTQAPAAVPLWAGKLKHGLSLSLVLLASVVLPYRLRLAFVPDNEPWLHLPTALLTMAGIVVAYGLLQRLLRYPNRSPLATTLSVVSLVFVFVLLGINLLHLMYSRALLAWSFLATVAFYAIQSAIASRQRQVRLGVVPGGRADRLGTLAGLTWVRLSSPDDSSAALKTSGLVIDTGLPLTPEWQRVVARCAVEGLPIFDARQLHELKTGRVGLDHMDAVYFSGLGQDRPYLAVKQVLDVGAALLVLPLVVPVVALAALAIRLDSRGPAFFLQKRVGHRGRIFVCYKLRSMYVAAEERAPESYGAVDPRVTPVGRVVRRFRIDELPQILNILRGEMSWIGPRPESLAWAQEYERHIPFYSVREVVKPGLSGWAAVWQGNVADVRAVAKKLQYDLFYIKHLSFELDVLIAVKTIWIIITGFGAR